MKFSKAIVGIVFGLVLWFILRVLSIIEASGGQYDGALQALIYGFFGFLGAEVISLAGIKKQETKDVKIEKEDGRG